MPTEESTMVKAELIDGKAIAASIRAELKAEVDQLGGKKPGLAVVLVGEDAASKVYVGMKAKACEEAGIYSEVHRLALDSTEAELLDLIDKLNKSNKIHGILVQHPIPTVKDENKVFNAIHPDKDVDCFHSENVGKLLLGEAYLKPCTPAGIMELLKRSGVKGKGKHAVVVGRSNIVGKPVFNLLLQKEVEANCTVTVVHTGTRDIPFYTRMADILVVAAGLPHYIKGEDIKEGAVVIDVGVNRIEDKSKKSGYRLVGDVDFDAALSKASKITPVPGGVGPMTIAMLMSNTLKAFKKMNVA
jgi:methylenetetrahydrofolate dehydrogenase (NADP+) / methenyltetrahydrofolate cyclohydrolase